MLYNESFHLYFYRFAENLFAIQQECMTHNQMNFIFWKRYHITLRFIHQMKSDKTNHTYKWHFYLTNFIQRK